MINPTGPGRVGQSPWVRHGCRCLSLVPGGLWASALNFAPQAPRLHVAVLGRCGLGVLRPGIKDGQRGAEGRAPAEGDASELAGRVREFRKMTGGLQRVVTVVRLR